MKWSKLAVMVAAGGSLALAGQALAQNLQQKPPSVAPGRPLPPPLTENRPAPAGAPPKAQGDPPPATVLTDAVKVQIQNASAAPLDVFVEPPAGAAPVFLMTLDASYEAVQPARPGVHFLLAQNDNWIGRFVVATEKSQVLRFTGKP